MVEVLLELERQLHVMNSFIFVNEIILFYKTKVEVKSFVQTMTDEIKRIDCINFSVESQFQIKF